MDPVFASVILGFFALILALVAVVYNKDSVARDAIKSLGRSWIGNQKEQDK